MPLPERGYTQMMSVSASCFTSRREKPLLYVASPFRLFREENAYSTVNVAACVVTLLVALRTTQRYIWPLR